MRKFSILVLVVILAGAFSVVGFAAEDTASADASFNVNSAITLSIKNGAVVDFGPVVPGNSYEEKNGTQLKVEANKDLEWAITKSKSSTTTGKLDALTVTLGTSSGTGKNNNIKVDYGLVVPAEMSQGNHTITVTFTASTA